MPKFEFFICLLICVVFSSHTLPETMYHLFCQVVSMETYNVGFYVFMYVFWPVSSAQMYVFNFFSNVCF